MDVLVIPCVPEQNIGEPTTLVEGDVVGGVDADIVGDEPRPMVPRPPVVPRPVVPRPVVATIAEVPGFDEGDDGAEVFAPVDVAVGELGELMTPELLTELHGAIELPTP